MPTNKDIGIAYNTSMEWAPKLGSCLDENPILLIPKLAEWLLTKYEGTDLNTAYTATAALKSSIDCVFHDKLYNIIDKKITHIPIHEAKLENVLNLADLLTKTALSKQLK